MLGAVAAADTRALIAIAVATGLFEQADAEALLGGVLDDLHADRLGAGHQAWAWTDRAGTLPVGWVYFAPEANADGVWNPWWIGVQPDRQGQRVGHALLNAVEASVATALGRLLINETSSRSALSTCR